MKENSTVNKDSLAYILALFNRYGDLDYGEEISQSSHAVQAALLAQRGGADDEMVLAAWLHDIGHLLPLADPSAIQASMGNYGMEAHDKIGEDFLLSIGCGDRLVAAVRSHVAAKRYLCYAEKAYFLTLSEASKATLLYQGGPMEAAEAKAFEQQAFFKEAISLRKWDDEAKEKGFIPPPAIWGDLAAKLAVYLSSASANDL